MKGLNEVRGQNDGNDSRKDVEKGGMKKVKRRRRGNKTFKGNRDGIDERRQLRKDVTSLCHLTGGLEDGC